MTDGHMRILRHIARQTQRELDHHNTLKPAGDAASTGGRDYLEHAAKRTRGQVAAAEQRRNKPDAYRDAQLARSPTARKARP